MPLNFWVEAFQMAVFFINHLPTPVLHGQTPLFLLKGIELDYTDLKPFGCACYPCLRPYNNHKFKFRSKKCVFLGVAAQQKGFKCLSDSGRVFVSQHVTFDTSLFPFASGFSTSKSQSEDGSNMSLIINLPQKSCFTLPDSTPIIQNEAEQNMSQFSLSGWAAPSSLGKESTCQPVDTSPGPAPPDTARPIIEDCQPKPTNNHPMVTRAKDGIVKPKYPYVGLLQTETSVVLHRSSELSSVDATLLSPEWLQAMKTEFNALT